MPESTAVGAPAGAETEQGKSIWQQLAQGVGIFLITQFAVKAFTGGGFSFSSTSSSSPSAVVGQPNYVWTERPPVAEIANYSSVPNNVAEIWPIDSVVDLQVYVSPSIALSTAAGKRQDVLVLDEKNIKMGDMNDVREIKTTIDVPTAVQHNATLWAHFFLGLSGSQLDPTAKDFDPARAVTFFRPLNQYRGKKKVKKLKNLLDSKQEKTEEEPEVPQGPQIGSFYHPNFTIAIVPGTGVVNWKSMHPALRKNVVLEPTGARDYTGQNGWYYPVVFLNTFWQLRSHMTELNDTVKTIPLNIEVKNFASWKYNIMASIDDSMKQSQAASASGNPMPGGGDGSELEVFKEILLDTNIYLLSTTFFVSILHMIFEGLAFKNDISHWRKKDNVGTSVRTIVANVFMQTVIFLYLVDNSDGTSWMILAGQGFGILLEAWKITKMVNVVVGPPGPDSRFSFLPYVILFEDKHKLSETEKKTQEYDEIAFQYLYMAAIPLLGAYAVYSLIYDSHKSWYSFVITTLVGSVYAYGFLMMVPSLYINYRLKSVAHIPSRAMTYKFLNTFIDDLFAFTIRMPTLHRLATLRDDVIFFVWLYQKYKYKVDYTRVNEFGQGGDSDDEGEEKKEVEGDGKLLEGQDVKELKPTAASTSATTSGREGTSGTGGKKRK